jgi:hypothetical protein
MTHRFDDGVVTAVIGHMNTDHADDSLLIVRAFGRPDATSAAMTGFDGDAGHWTAATPAGQAAVVVPWPSGPITERRDVRREVVALYDEACLRLGRTPRPHA